VSPACIDSSLAVRRYEVPMEFGIPDVKTSRQTAEIYRPILPRKWEFIVQINKYGLAQGRLPYATDIAIHSVYYGPPSVERGDSPQGLFRV
jgi:hypothetical protein